MLQDAMHEQIVEKWGVMRRPQRSAWTAKVVGGWKRLFIRNRRYYGTPPDSTRSHTIPQYAETGSGMLSVMHLMIQKGFAINLQLVDVERPKAMTDDDNMIMERKIYASCEMMLRDCRACLEDGEEAHTVSAGSSYAPDAVALCAVLSVLTIPEQGKG